jgi:hypothetical protein
MKFSPANTKLKKLSMRIGLKVYSFDLLSGHSCPGAKDCLAYSNYDPDTDSYSLVDGPDQQFRCYSASQEHQYTGVYNHRLANLESIREFKSTNKLATALCNRLPKDAKVIRIHSSGDFDSKRYFQAWLLVARRNPHIHFYAYTKMLPFWIANVIPDNMVLTASRGGKFDHLIDQHNLREVIVVYSEQEAETRGLELDNDDHHAYDPDRRSINFALLIHGMGKAGSEQAKVATKHRRAKMLQKVTV